MPATHCPMEEKMKSKIGIVILIFTLVLITSTFALENIGLADNWIRLNDLDGRLVNLDRIVYVYCKPFIGGGGVPQIIFSIDGQTEFRIVYDKPEQADTDFQKIMSILKLTDK